MSVAHSAASWQSHMLHHAAAWPRTLSCTAPCHCSCLQYMLIGHQANLTGTLHAQGPVVLGGTSPQQWCYEAKLFLCQHCCLDSAEPCCSAHAEIVFAMPRSHLSLLGILSVFNVQAVESLALSQSCNALSSRLVVHPMQSIRSV